MHIKFAHLAALAALAIPVLAAPLQPSDLTAPDAVLGLAKREPSGSGGEKLPTPPPGSKPGKTYPGGHKPEGYKPRPPKSQPLPRPEDLSEKHRKGPHPLPRPPKDKGGKGKRSIENLEEIVKREPSGSGGEKLPTPPPGSKPGKTYPGGHKPEGYKPRPPKSQPLPRPKGPHPLPAPPKDKKGGKGKRSTDEAI